MKKLYIIILTSLLVTMPVFAKTDRTSVEYLKNKRHFAIVNPIAENFVEKLINKALKEKVGKFRYKTKFEIYTLSSLKRGIFKRAEVTAYDFSFDNIPIKYVNIKSLDEYIWIDVKSDPMKFKSDANLEYNIELTEESINAALDKKDYQKKLAKINNIAYPLFTIHDLNIRVKNDNFIFIMSYSLPLSSSNKVRTFTAASNFIVENGKIKVDNIKVDKTYAKMPLHKIANLLNLLDPLTFTLSELTDNKCKSKIESVKVEDNIIKINGKIFIKGSTEISK